MQAQTAGAAAEPSSPGRWQGMARNMGRSFSETVIHVGDQQTAGSPVGQTGTANPSRGRDANEQQAERQEQGCQSGVPHGLPLGQGTQNIAARPEGGWQDFAVQQQGAQCQ